jgi:hypothetical protein
MNTQKQVESAKDDDFDFFKKPKNFSTPNAQQEVTLQKEVLMPSASSKAWNKNLLFLIAGFIPMVLFLVMKETNTSSSVYTIPKEGIIMHQVPAEPKIVEAPTNSNKNEQFNVDYSNLSKEDAARVKQALEQFKDVQKTLIETNKPITKPQK